MFSLALEDNPIESRAQSHKRSRMIEVTMATNINTWMKKKSVLIRVLQRDPKLLHQLPIRFTYQKATINPKCLG